MTFPHSFLNETLPRCLNDHSNIFDFFNNATIAAVIATILATYLARGVYRQQKSKDRKSDIIKDISKEIILLKEKADFVILIIDRVTYSHDHAKENKIDIEEDIFNEERDLLSVALNNDIPVILSRIETYIFTYFELDEEVNVQFATLTETITKWHSLIVSDNFNPRVRVKEQPNLSTDTLAKEIKKLIRLLNTK